MKKAFLCVLWIFVLMVGCQKKTDMPEEDIIARVGNRVISKNEFIRRSEYTLRPPYCKQGDLIIHKKIILNSLIAEKLMALEGGGNNRLMQNKIFQAYIQGRREQAMRKMLYNQQAIQKVKLSKKALSDMFRAVGRKYHIQYFNLPDSAEAARARHIITANPDRFVSVFEKYYGRSEVPERDVAWSDYETPQVETALFTRPLENGSIIGPLKIEDGQYLFMRVDGWTEKRVFADDDVKNRWHRVRERLTLHKAAAIWNQYIGKVMKGKRLEFREGPFFQLAEIFADVYHLKENEKQGMFIDRFWSRSREYQDMQKIEDALREASGLQNAPLFTLDGQLFTVQDFRTMLASHPLVFRKRRFSREEFPKQFKLSVADMIADQYLNREAYEKGLDQHPWVRRTEMMWKDALNGMFHRNAYLDSIGKKEAFIENYPPVIRNDLNPYVRSLQQKYSDQIEINADLLKQIRLTRIDMFAIQKWEPYPIIVPQFPVVTDEHRLDYGKDIKSD